MPCSKLPCEPGRYTGASADNRATALTPALCAAFLVLAMHPAPFRVEEVMAYDFYRAEAASKWVGDKGARAVPGLAAHDERQPYVFAQGRGIADRRNVAQRVAGVLLVHLFNDMRAAVKRPVVERDEPHKLQPVGGGQPFPVHHGRADKGLLLRQHPVQMQVACRR